jgi:hypothetical protein
MLKVTLKNKPIKTFPVELSMPDAFEVKAHTASAFQKVSADGSKATVLIDDVKNGTLIMYASHKEAIFQIVPPSSVIRNSDGDITTILLNDDVPRVHGETDGRRVDLERD